MLWFFLYSCHTVECLCGKMDSRSTQQLSGDDYIANFLPSLHPRNGDSGQVGGGVTHLHKECLALPEIMARNFRINCKGIKQPLSMCFLRGKLSGLRKRGRKKFKTK